MKINKKDCKIETMKGTGPGGAHRNSTDSAVRITHIPTGISAYADERSQAHSKKKAWADIKNKLKELKQEKLASQKQARRDHLIKNCRTVRTYDYKSQTVKDHRTKRVASLKEVLKGKIWLLWDKK